MVYDTETERYVPKWRLEEYPGINRDFKETLNKSTVEKANR